MESLFERPASGERAILVHVDLAGADPEDRSDVDELAELARAAGADIAGLLRTRRARPYARFFIGSGKTEELAELVTETEAQLVIFDHELSPAQERNLEAAVQARVLSRTGLILDIFAQRARTHEGKLQVELAQLDHMSTRLVRGWTHLDRQKGGIGMRGAGETQLEMDQRLIQERIASITARLETVRKRRALSRRSRQRNDVPLIALVGYTNTGKSTLFNVLSHAGVLEANQLFATLDPTLRRIDVPGFGPAVIADTVGFVRRLPHKLVDSFKATLEEVVEADLLLHVLDASDPAMADKREDVHAVLAEMDAMDVPRVEILNKIDATDDATPALVRGDGARPLGVRLSAADETGLELLSEAIAEVLGHAVRLTATLTPAEGRLRASFYASGWVEAERSDEDGNLQIDLHLPAARVERLEADGVRLRPIAGPAACPTGEGDVRVAAGVLAAPGGPT